MHVQKIIQLIHEQNEQGIEELLRHYGPLMRYIIAPILPNEQDQEECISDVVWRVWEIIDTYNPQLSKWTTWLTVLTRNTALNKLRTTQSRNSTESLDDVPTQLASNAGVDISPMEWKYMTRGGYLHRHMACALLPR